MKIESPRFGTLEIEPEKIIEFPRGLPGFEDCRRFTLFHPEGEDPKYFILQSLDDPAIAFYLTDPARFDFSYQIALSDDEMQALLLTDPAEIVVAVILTKPDDAGPLTANLKAPLVLNLAAKRGIQHVFADLKYVIRPEAKD